MGARWGFIVSAMRAVIPPFLAAGHLQHPGLGHSLISLVCCSWLAAPATRPALCCAALLCRRVPVLQGWALLVGWLKGSKAAEAFGEAGVTNLAHVSGQCWRFFGGLVFRCLEGARWCDCWLAAQGAGARRHMSLAIKAVHGYLPCYPACPPHLPALPRLQVLRMSMTKATGGQLLAGHPDRWAAGWAGLGCHG